MRIACTFTVVLASTAIFLAGCGSSVIAGNGSGSSGSNVPVSLTMTDDPPAGVSVLFFQVSLTAASLTPASGSPVSLLSNNTPVQIDVTQLQAFSAFLSTANVPAGTYNSLALTFANPQLVILNTSDTALGASCAVGSICQITPTLDNSATTTLSSSPFPLTVSANSPQGFLIDFHLNTIIQSDLSINLGVSNGITLAQLPSTASSGSPQFGFITGTVQSLNPNQNEFTLQTAWGATLTIDVNSSTTYNDFPACASNTSIFSCLATGQIVQVQVASIESDGDPLAAQVTYVQAANQQTVEGTIVAIPTLPLPAGETIIDVLLHQNPTNSSSLPLGGIASVAIWSSGSGSNTTTTFSVDTQGFTDLPTSDFTVAGDLIAGQDVQLTVVPGSLTPPSSTVVGSNWGPPAQLSFTASNVQLEPGQITGTIASISSPSVTLDSLWSPCTIPGSGVVCNVVALVQHNVETTSQTNYQGFTPDDFSGLTVNDLVSVRGWLFAQNGVLDPAVGPPFVVAQTVALHPGGVF